MEINNLHMVMVYFVSSDVANTTPVANVIYRHRLALCLPERARFINDGPIFDSAVLRSVSRMNNVLGESALSVPAVCVHLHADICRTFCAPLAGRLAPDVNKHQLVCQVFVTSGIG